MSEAATTTAPVRAPRRPTDLANPFRPAPFAKLSAGRASVETESTSSVTSRSRQCEEPRTPHRPATSRRRAPPRAKLQRLTEPDTSIVRVTSNRPAAPWWVAAGRHRPSTMPGWRSAGADRQGSAVSACDSGGGGSSHSFWMRRRIVFRPKNTPGRASTCFGLAAAALVFLAAARELALADCIRRSRLRLQQPRELLLVHLVLVPLGVLRLDQLL